MPRLIDADALLMDNSWAFYDENGNRNDACIAVENAPTVDAEPLRHGHWTNHLCEDGATDGIFCSQCDYETDRDSRPNYCPNCGAKMDKGEKMPRLIDADKLRERMYHNAFEIDSDMQKWDSGCWIRYKLFENALEDAPTVDAVPLEDYKSMEQTVNKLTKAIADAEPVRHGHWDTKYLSEDEDWSGIEHTIGRCSVCRGKIDIVGKRIPYLYCPNCGAKMDEVEDG